MLACVYETTLYEDNRHVCKFNIRGDVVTALLWGTKEDDGTVNYTIYFNDQKNSQPRLHDIINDLQGKKCKLISYNGSPMLEIEHVLENSIPVFKSL
jgi:hypothetical protein